MKRFMLTSVAWAASATYADGFGMGYGHMGYGGLGGLTMWIAMVVFWMSFLAAAIWLVRTLLIDRHRYVQDSEGAVAIVKQRYARGEISETEMNDIIEKLQ